MPNVAELSARLNVPVAQVVRMGEQQVTNTNSAIYKAIEDKVGAKLAALKANEEREGVKKAKHRVYVQHSVPAARRYELATAYPQFQIVFTGVDKRAAAVAHAAYLLVVEYMFSQFKVNKGEVIAYGVSIKQMIMRNRFWTHVCIPGHVASAQVEFFKDDRAILAMLNYTRRKGRDIAIATAYATGDKKIHCTSPHICDVVAPGGVMLLNRTDTNFRQIAYFMKRKQIKLQFVAIPGNKYMETCMEGPLPELDAYVMPSDDGKYISISYKNAPSLDFTYTYANYLEIVARTSVVLSGHTYHKEFLTRVQGLLVYKITTIQGTFEEEPVSYKSWIEPTFRHQYMVYAPVLKPYGCVTNVSDWAVVGHPVDRSLVDDVVDHAMRAQGAKDISREIEMRLFSRTSNFALAGQIINTTGALPLSLFELVALSVYTTVFMRKYQDGATIATLAPHAREMAHLARAMPTQLLKMYVGTLVGNVLRKMDVVTTTLRKAYYEAVGATDLPMPSFSVCPGFVEYSDGASSNPRFNGWLHSDFSDVRGFTNMLPGVRPVDMPDDRSVVSTATSVSEAGIAQLCATGDAFVHDSRLKFADDKSMVEVACGVFSSLRGVFEDIPDVELELDRQRNVVPTPVKVPDHVSQMPAKRDLLFVSKPQKTRHVIHNPEVDQLVARVNAGYQGLRDLGVHQKTENVLLFSPGVPPIVPGHYASDAYAYLESGIRTIFPESLTMQTQHFESDRQFSGWNIVAKAISARLDVSKITGVKPESFYLPLIKGHVQPNVKETFNTTLHTLVKRNMNTPADADPLDIDFLWDRAWDAVCKVFYVPGAAEQLERMESIGPNKEALEEWVSKLDEPKRDRLLKHGEGFTLPELVDGASRNHLMLKPKLKPALDASYTSSVKYPQSIQYDPTGKVVASYSPVFAQKVAREQELLKPNVFIMQGKSVDDVNRFLNDHDWRPDHRGPRRYIEIDYEQFDKSQGRTVAEFFLRKCAKFGVLKDIVNFIRDFQYTRSVASMRAGIMAILKQQNPSGAPFTLDRNNDVNMLAIAEILLRIISQIEFIMMMGDDVLIAIRGDVDVSGWETEINRKYNLSLKVSVNDHGYFCSMDIVHYPDGHSAAVPDVIKRSLAFMDLSMKDEEKFDERYTSYVDIMPRVQDLGAQMYLSVAIPKRMRAYMPTVTEDAILNLMKAHARFCVSKEQWRAMFDMTKTVRHG